MKTIESNFTRKAHALSVYPLLFLFIILLAASCSPEISSLPYLGVHETSEQVVEGNTLVDTQYYQIPPFELIDQDSVLLTEGQVKNKVYVAYFFFTSCPATCPIMTSAMKRVYKMVGADQGFEIIAHTIDPKRDTPEKLKQFAIKNEVEHQNWHFLTGEMDYIYNLGMKGYYLSMGKHDAAPGGYIHSAKFILVDQNRHIRGIYEGTDANEVAQMIEGIQFLLKG
jgi:protein SCO1/2